VDAVDIALKDEAFQLSSPCASTTISCARAVSTWIKGNRSEAEKFERELILLLNTCLQQPKVKSASINRERMWCAYHQLRTSDEYIKKWEKFLQTAGIAQKSTMFLQSTGDHIFKALVKINYPLTEQESTSSQRPLTYMETNAVRYAAGYVPRSLKKKLTKSVNPIKEDLLLCLAELIDIDGSEPHVDDSTDWLEKINRGGLIKVKNDTFDVFMAMEHCLRFQINESTIPSFDDKVKEEIVSSPDVHFVWSLLSSDWEEETSDELLKMIVSEWVKICGFHYASGWIEKYKNTQKQTMQKSKGLRKQLQS